MISPKASLYLDRLKITAPTRETALLHGRLSLTQMTCKDITLPRTSQGYILGGLNEKYEMLYFDTQFAVKVCRKYSAVRGPGTVMWTEAGGVSPVTTMTMSGRPSLLVSS